jgi:hypothetical protein
MKNTAVPQKNDVHARCCRLAPKPCFSTSNTQQGTIARRRAAQKEPRSHHAASALFSGAVPEKTKQL